MEKDKEAKRTSNVFLEMRPFCIHESSQKLSLSTDTDSSALEIPGQLETLTCSSKKAKKKKKKRHLLSQECEKERSEAVTPQAKAKLDFVDVEDGLPGETSPHEEPPRKKKEKLEQTVESVAHDECENDALRKKEKKKKKKRSRDELEEMSVTLKSDENEMLSDERTGDSGKKKKKKKDKESDIHILESSTLSEQSVHENGSRDLHEMGVANGGCNALTEQEEHQAENVRVKKKKKKKDKEKHDQIETLESETFVKDKSFTDLHEMDSVNKATEPGANQTENILINKKKEKKSKHEGKQNQTQVLESATTAAAAAAQSVEEKGSTDPQETEDHEVEPEESSPKKGRKKNSNAHNNGDLKTRETQTVLRRIRPKTEQVTDVGSEDDRVQIGTGFKNKNNGKRGPKTVDRRLLEELKQFLPNIESRTPADINKLINYDLPRYKEFKKKGIPLTRGRFSVKENEILKKNVEDFLALTGIDSGNKLFYTDRFPAEQQTIKALKKNHRFFATIANGIPRSCHDVYARGRKIFDSNAYKGTFSKSELHQLSKLQTLYGNNWKKISELTGRSALSLEKRYSQLTERTGLWSKKEVQKLLRAVRDHFVSVVQPRASNIGAIQISREMLFKGLPWRTISEKVKTRCWNKCREKWLAVLAVKMSNGAVQTEDARENKVKLIKAMYQMQVEDCADVNWDQLSALFGNVPPFYVQKKWNKLKIKHVPNWQSKCFADIVDFLYENVLPLLETETSCQADDITQLTKNPVTSFCLSDIFGDVKDQDSEEEEDDAGEESHMD